MAAPFPFARLAPLLLLLSPAAAPGSPATELPFTTPSPESRHILLQARLGGQGPFTLLLDTGYAAPFTVALSARAAARAGASPAPGAPYISRAAVGGPVRFEPYSLSGLTLGPIRLGRVSTGVTAAIDTVAAAFGAPLDGVVGHDFLAERVIAIDYICRRVDVEAQAPDTAPTATFTVAPIRPLMVVSARINGRGPYRLVVDTGAGTTILAPAAAASAAVATGPPTPLAGAGGRDDDARAGRAEIALGTAPPHPTGLAVAALVERVAREAGAPIDGIAGTQLFADGRLVIDYPGRRLWLLPSGPCRK
jgi:predicted aspartyl protease